MADALSRKSYCNHLMSSNEVMQEMASFQVATKLAQGSRNRAIGMHKGASLALKAKVVAKVVDQEDEVESEEEIGRAHV